MIHDLREKTPSGEVAEEFRCAQAIDWHGKVKQWVRNIQVGHQWEQSSDGRCVFVFAVRRDDDGRDLFQQLANKLG